MSTVFRRRDGQNPEDLIPRPGGRRVEHLHAVLVHYHRSLCWWGKRAGERGPQGERAQRSEDEDEDAGKQRVALGPGASTADRGDGVICPPIVSVCRGAHRWWQVLREHARARNVAGTVSA